MSSRMIPSLRFPYATQSQGYCYAPVDFLDGLQSPAREAVVGRQLRAWRRNGAIANLVIYDVLPLVHPEWFSLKAVGNFRMWFDVLLVEADQVICISDQVARELCEQLALAGADERPAIGRLQMGADIRASLPSHGISDATRQLIQRLPFRSSILMVGTIEPRKGYDTARRAFEHLWNTRPKDAPDLIIVGKAGWKTENLQHRIRAHPQHGKRLHWLDRVNDQALCGFYEGCRGVFMASRAEGFGLPLIEAAAHGRYILARKLPVFREQGLPNVMYFDDDRPNALVDKLMELLRAGQRGAAPAMSLPSWSDCADRLLLEIEQHGSQSVVSQGLFRAAL